MKFDTAWLPSSSAATDNEEQAHRRKPRMKGNNSDTDNSDECTTSGDWLPKTLVIENKIIASKSGENKNADGPCGSLVGCLSNKKVIYVIILYAVIATGLWSFFFSRSFGLFSRKSQIEELTEQVKILDSEIDELETQVDRLGGEVSKICVHMTK